MDNIQKLKEAPNASAKVGKFESKLGDSISLRASPLKSPYDDSYAMYLTEAIKQELALANMLKPDSNVEITGELLQNNIDASGFSTASGVIEARFVVKKGNVLRYDRNKKINHQWESSFMGAVAIPRAQQTYPVMVQMLLAELFSDPEFINALK